MSSPAPRFLRTVLLATVLAAPAAAHALGISDGNYVNRTSEGIELSGITWAGGDTYYAVNDTNASNRLYKLTFSVDSSGQVSSYNVVSSVTLAGSSDLEGCAYDPASGHVWVSMEGNNSSIREYDPETGAWLRTAPLPTVFKNNMRGNFKFEALTIAGDGLTMWTANEEALECDGDISAKPRATGGTTVRLQKFTRASVRDNWTAAEQYAYKTYGLNYAYGYNNAQRSGVAGLCALPNGQLLVLEREFSGTDDNSNLSSIWTGLDSSFTMAIVLADYSAASDVSTLPSLDQATYTPVVKTKLYEGNTGYANYEGICLGPRISNDSVSLLLISDGGGNSMVQKRIMSKKLTGIDVRTLYVEGADESEPVGGPYRHIGGTTVTAALPGTGSPYEPVLRVHPAWTAITNDVSGDGSSASFAIAADDTLRWSVATNFDLPMLGADSFERLAPGTEAEDLSGWSGEGWVQTEAYSPALPPGWPLALETHANVLAVDGGAVRSYASVPGAGAKVDAMLRGARETGDSPVEDADGQVALFFAADGRATLQHRSADGTVRLRTPLSPRVFADGDWVRASLVFDYATDPSGAAWCQVRLDGSPCVTDAGVRSPADPVPPGSWYRTLDGGAAGKVAELAFHGSGAVDDLALYDAAGAFEFDGPVQTNGVPYSWFNEQGLAWDPAADVDDDARDALAEYTAGTDPWDPADYLRILGTGFDELGRFTVLFNGAADLSRFTVEETEDLADVAAFGDAAWSDAEGAGSIQRLGGTNVWTQAEQPTNAPPSRFFRVKAELP